MIEIYICLLAIVVCIPTYIVWKVQNDEDRAKRIVESEYRGSLFKTARTFEGNGEVLDDRGIDPELSDLRWQC